MKLETYINNHPLKFIAGIIITTVSITASVVTFAFKELIIEHYKLEIERYQSDASELKGKLNSEDSTIYSLRHIVQEQTKVQIRQDQDKGTFLRQQKAIRKSINQIEEAIDKGNAMISLDPTDPKSFKALSEWQLQCSSFLGRIDAEALTDYKNTFITVTNTKMSDYEQFQARIKDGLSLLTQLVYINNH